MNSIAEPLKPDSVIITDQIVHYLSMKLVVSAVCVGCVS